MVCKICGKELPKGSSVCPYCGAKNSTPGSKHRKSKKAKKRQRIVSIIVIVLAMLILAAVVFGVIRMVQKLSSAADPNDSYTLEPKEDNEKEEPSGNDDKTLPEKQPEKKDDDPTEKPDETVPGGNVTEPTEPVKPEQQEEKTEEKTEEPGKTDEPENPGTEAKEDPQPTEQPQGQTKFTLYVSKEETTATLRHYREIKYGINETLPSGVSIKKVEWLPDDTSICHAEEVDGLCRLWGDKYGETTVTLRVTLSDGSVADKKIAFTCAEKQPETNNGETGSGAALGDSNYVLKNSDTRIYSENELKTLSKHDLMIARNEIYARHGYIFSDPELKSYFESKSWYHGTDTKETFNYNCLNSTESQNVKNIKAVEASK